MDNDLTKKTAYHDFALVVPAWNEAPNIPRLIPEVRAAFEEYGLTGEVILVDDGSTDGTADLAESEGCGWDRLRVLRHRVNQGKTEALLTAAEATDRKFLVLFDADLQHLPAEIPRYLDKLEEGWDIVTGRKVGQYDKRAVSSIYNALSRRIFKVPVSDLNSMKAFRADVLKAVRLRHDWHRFFVVLAHRKGFSATEIDIELHPRRAGEAKYSGKSRIIGGVLDLMAVWFQLRFSRKPMVAFGLPGVFLMAAGVLTGLAALYLRFVAGQGFRPLLYLVVLLVTVGVLCFAAGMLGEMIASVHDELDAMRRERGDGDAGRGRSSLARFESARPQPRILSVIGTRPEAIKMAPVVGALVERGQCVHRLALTGQHTDMVGQVLDVFGLEADYDLKLMKPGQTLYDVGHACMDGLREVAEDFVPDVTIVQGDTATVFFAGVVTFFQQGRLAHVEAGLRSRRKWSPFPEEMLRRMTDTISDFCFAPTTEAADNLAAEGVEAARIFVTGNTVVDALLQMRARPATVRNECAAELVRSHRRLVLLTAHRRESFGQPLERVFGAVATLAERFEDIDILYPVHPNPRVLEPARRILGGQPRIHLTDPLDYSDLVTVLGRASLVLTDSGGIQEEAPAFGVHTLVLREVTERPEGVRAGAATLVGTDADLILAEAAAHLSGERDACPAGNPYGDGRAGERIADILLAELAGTRRQLEDWTAP